MTDVCPLVSVSSRERVEGEIARAEDEGAKLVLDGRIGGGAGGALLGPRRSSTTPGRARRRWPRGSSARS